MRLLGRRKRETFLHRLGVPSEVADRVTDLWERTKPSPELVDRARELPREALDRTRPALERARPALDRARPAIERARALRPGARRPTRMERAKTPLLVAGGIAVGAAAVYFLDPQQGRARRARAKDRTATAIRGVTRGIRSRGPFEIGRAALVGEVERELLGHPEIPLARVRINAENGKIVLRGELDSDEQVKLLEETVRSVEGVREIENLCHVSAGPETESSEGEDTTE